MISQLIIAPPSISRISDISGGREVKPEVASLLSSTYVVSPWLCGDVKDLCKRKLAPNYIEVEKPLLFWQRKNNKKTDYVKWKACSSLPPTKTKCYTINSPKPLCFFDLFFSLYQGKGP